MGADLPQGWDRCHQGSDTSLRSNAEDGCSRQTPYAASKTSQELRTKVVGHRGRKSPMGQPHALPACSYP